MSTTYMFNAVIAMLQNEATGRFHPIIFREDPLPGPPSESKPVRHKSVGHHTEGFDDREDAHMHIVNDLAPKIDPAPRIYVGEDFKWDGEDIPAQLEFFDSETLTPFSELENEN